MPLADSLSRRIQHVFNKDAVSLGGVVYQNIGHRPHQPAVLDDGTSRHECVKGGTTIFCVFLQNILAFDGE